MRRITIAAVIFIGLVGSANAQFKPGDTSTYPNLLQPVVLAPPPDLPDVAECHGILSQIILDLVDPACQSPTGGSANTFGTMSLFGSTDGGATWTYKCAPWNPGASGGVTSAVAWFGSDPALAWDNQGRAYACYMLISENASGSNFGASI